MKRTGAIALFDMDGVLCDFYGAMRRDLERIASPSDKRYEDVFSKDLPAHIRRRIRMIKQSIGWWERLDELKPGFDILKAARSIGYDINVLTKGPTTSLNAYTEKVAWVKAHVPDAKITISDDKGIVYGRVLVEDYPVYIRRWLAHRPNGLVIMPKNRFNKAFRHPQVIMYDGRNIAAVKRALREQLKRRPANPATLRQSR